MTGNLDAADHAGNPIISAAFDDAVIMRANNKTLTALALQKPVQGAAGIRIRRKPGFLHELVKIVKCRGCFFRKGQARDALFSGRELCQCGKLLTNALCRIHITHIHPPKLPVP